MRYVTKYAAKSGRHNELLNEIIEYLSQRSMDVIPTNNMVTHPLMRFCDGEYCDENMYTEMAKVAAVSCIHNCI